MTPPHTQVYIFLSSSILLYKCWCYRHLQMWHDSGILQVNGLMFLVGNSASNKYIVYLKYYIFKKHVVFHYFKLSISIFLFVFSSMLLLIWFLFPLPSCLLFNSQVSWVRIMFTFCKTSSQFVQIHSLVLLSWEFLALQIEVDWTKLTSYKAGTACTIHLSFRTLWCQVLKSVGFRVRVRTSKVFPCLYHLFTVW